MLSFFFRASSHIQIQLANWQASHPADMLRIRSVYLLFIWLHVLLAACIPWHQLWFLWEVTKETSTFYLQGTLQSVTVRRLLMLAYFSLIKLFMPDTQHTWPLFARFTCVNFDSAKSHSLNRYTNRYSNCYGECNCDLNWAVKEIQLNEKTEIASWISFSSTPWGLDLPLMAFGLLPNCNNYQQFSLDWETNFVKRWAALKSLFFPTF